MVTDTRLPMMKQWVSFVASTPRKTLIQNYCPFKQQAWISDLQSDRSHLLVALLQRCPIRDFTWISAEQKSQQMIPEVFVGLVTR